ncbi:hypothetical protein I317_04724 [Kwoniella heveanensis CBS 569]|uniref:RTA1-domain-containing protein n=1 Tax=Kwoniella heveanensis BCC8398 TaxID=1296120 RepID=A0A1B9GZN2_9TREE|nr:hypothetical protein I316_01718 [Kwoniella heveanensis BCC8398]OCF41423.1 hypothetical protein I317_04724 [Kwoniella heveanensis CBS 569]
MSGITYKGPINPNPKDDEAGIIIYGYVPSLALGIIGIITFVLVAAGHAFWFLSPKGRVRGRRWFHGLLFIGALMEIGGYAARLASHKRPFVISSFIAQYFLIVVAPVLFSAAIYLSLSLAARGFEGGERLLVIRPKMVLAFFVSADVICTVIQVVGAALIGSSESAQVRGKPSSITPEQANDILLAGLAVQCFSFTCFLLILLVAIYRSSRRTAGSNSYAFNSASHHPKLRSFLWVILATGLLILLRTTFRLAETGQGFFGFASTHESLFGTLEYLPVILALAIWAIFPPARFLPPLGQEGGNVQDRPSVSSESGRGLTEKQARPLGLDRERV